MLAWPASIAPLQCKGLNLTSASVMGNWTASFADRLLLIYRWTPFPAVSGRDPPKRAPPQHQGSPLPFSRWWTPFPAVSGRDPPKRGAATWHLCSSHFGFNLLFLWCRESALLLCKRIPLRHYNARAWTWPPLLWRETGLLLLLIGFSLSTAGPLSQPWAAEILQRGAPQPDVKRAAIWFFSVPLPHTEAVPPSALSVPVLCASQLVRVAFFWQIPFPKHCSEWALPSTPFYTRLT